MKVVFDIRDMITNKTVGNVIICGNFGEKAFRDHLDKILKFYETLSLKSDDEIPSSEQTIMKEEKK